MNIEIEHILDENTKEEYSFWMNENILYLDSYRILRRVITPKIKSSKFEIIQFYSRLARVNSWDTRAIKLEDIKLTDELKNEVLDKLRSTVKVEKWNK